MAMVPEAVFVDRCLCSPKQTVIKFLSLTPTQRELAVRVAHVVRGLTKLR